MKNSILAGMLFVFGVLTTANALQARPPEKATVNVPFSFAVGNQVLPPGSYQIEMLMRSKPGQDRIEVITIRGLERYAYAAVVTSLDRADAGRPRLTFRSNGKTPELTEVDITGKALRLAGADEQPEVASIYRTVTIEEGLGGE